MKHVTLKEMERAFVRRQRNGYRWLESAAAADKTVVLIHGVTGGKEDMLPLAREYEKQGYLVRTIDLPGHGDSAWNNHSSFDKLSDWLGGFLDTVGMPDLLVSNSFSSAVLYRYLQRYAVPKNTHVVLACPTPKISRLSRNMYLVSKFAPTPLRLNWYLYTAPPANVVRAYLLGKQRGDESSKKWLAESEKRKRQAVIAEAGMGMSTMLFVDNPYDGPRLPEKTQRQMTVILGTKDNVVTADTESSLRELLPYAKHIAADGAGHILHFEALPHYPAV